MGRGVWHVAFQCLLWTRSPSISMHSPIWGRPNLFLIIQIEKCNEENVNNVN